VVCGINGLPAARLRVAVSIGRPIQAIRRDRPAILVTIDTDPVSI